MNNWIKLPLLALFYCHLLSAEFTEVSASDLSSAHNGINHGVGVASTVFRTWGFTYRHHFPSRLGVAASLGGALKSYYGQVSAGVGGLYTLAHHQFPSSFLANSSLRIYLTLLGGLSYERDQKSTAKGASYTETTQHLLNIGIGPGPGAEYFFTKNLAIHFELPWMTTFTIKPNPAGLYFTSSHLYPGCGFSYYF